MFDKHSMCYLAPRKREEKKRKNICMRVCDVKRKDRKREIIIFG